LRTYQDLFALPISVPIGKLLKEFSIGSVWAILRG
jgi:hypothetical protein